MYVEYKPRTFYLGSITLISTLQYLNPVPTFPPEKCRAISP